MAGDGIVQHPNPFFFLFLSEIDPCNVRNRRGVNRGAIALSFPVQEVCNFSRCFFFYLFFWRELRCACTFHYRSIKSQCVGLFPVNRAGRGAVVPRAANIGFPITVLYPWLLLRDHNTTSAFPHSISTYSIFLCFPSPGFALPYLSSKQHLCRDRSFCWRDEKGDGDSSITIKDPPRCT